MSFFNLRSLYKIPQPLRKKLVHYPDIILFDLSEDDYQIYWSSISRSKYLLTNGYEIKPTNWLGFAFQTFRGWLGFRNKCSNDVVQMALQKLAYHGYIAGYDQSKLNEPTHHPLDPFFKDLVSKPRNNATTNALQQKLNLFYLASSLSQKSGYQSNQAFGNSWASIGLWEEIPQLDPQDLSLIDSTIKALNKEFIEGAENTPTIEYDFLPSSLYTTQAVKNYINKARVEKQSIFYNFWPITTARKKAHFNLELALALSPNCEFEELGLFIDYYLEHSNHKKAFQLMELLADPSDAVNYLLKQFTEQQRLQYVIKDSPIAQNLAKYYLNNNQASLAAKYITDVADFSLEQAFDLLVDQDKPDKAYELFIKNQSTVFAKSSCKKLAASFAQEGEALYEKGVEKRKVAESSKKIIDLKQAKVLYFRSLVAMRKALLLDDDEKYQELVYTHQRLFAQIVIRCDIAANKPNNCDVEDIEAAITLLDKCKSKDKEERKIHLTVLVNGLMRQADALMYRIAVDKNIATASHNEKHKKTFAQITQLLERVIKLLEGTKETDFRLILGKAHFMLGDMWMFFDVNADFKEHFALAIKAVPKNPYYLLRGAEHFPEKKKDWQEQGMNCMDDSKSSGSYSFYQWDEYRWNKEGSVYGSVHTIHHKEGSVPEESVITRLKNNLLP